MKYFNYSNILVGLDNSQATQRTALKAIEIAKNNNANLYIAAIINNQEIIGVSKANMINFGGANAETIERVKNETQAMIDHYVQLGRQAGVMTTGIIRVGNPKIELAKTLVSDYQIDEIIIGATGANAISRVLMGSTAEFVIDNAQCDVLVARNEN